MQIREIKSASECNPSLLSEWLSCLTGREHIVAGKDIAHVVESQNSHLFILENDGGEPCGMMTVSICHILSHGICAWLDDVFVAPDCRHMNYGKALVSHAIGFARQEGASMLNLTSSPYREAAIALYTKMGFEKRDSNIYRKVL